MKRKAYICTMTVACIGMSLVMGGCAGGGSVPESTYVIENVSDKDTDIDWRSEAYTTMDVSSGSVNISESGIYLLTGTLEDGTVTVETNKETDLGTVYLVLDNLTIGSNSTSPIYIKEAKKVVMILEGETESVITQGKDIKVDEKGNPSGAIYSQTDLTITGTGALAVTTGYNDGITGKDDLKITGGIITINSAGDGIVGKDLLAIETADITIEAGKDGLRASNSTDTSQGNIIISDGTFHITAANDAIQAEQNLQIEGGTFQLVSGGGYQGIAGTDPETTDTGTTESMKALKAGTAVLVNGGNFNISSYEDAVHSNGDVTIGGGIWSIEAGDDGIHADAVVTVDGGQLAILNSYEAIEGSEILIQDGTMELTSSNDGINVSSQTGTLTVNGGTITLKSSGDGLDSNGNIVQNGGSIIIYSSLVGAGDTSVDFDGTFTSNGGTLTDENGNTISTQAGNRGGSGGGRGQGAPNGESGAFDKKDAPDMSGTPGARPEKMEGETINGDENL